MAAEKSAPVAELLVHLSSDLDAPVWLKLEKLEGARASAAKDSDVPELSAIDAGPLAADRARAEVYVTCQLFIDDVAVGVPLESSTQAYANRCQWGETLCFPARVRDLSRDACLAVAVWQSNGPGELVPLGSAVVPLFSRRSLLKQGRKKLTLAEGASVGGRDGVAAGAGPAPRLPPPEPRPNDEMSRIEKRMRQFDRGEIPETPWLDRQTFRKIELLNRSLEGKRRPPTHLYVELPTFEYPVAFHVPEAKLALGSAPAAAVSAGPSAAAAAPAPAPAPAKPLEVVLVDDPEALRESPADVKQHKLNRSALRGTAERTLKPNLQEYKQIQRLLHGPVRTRALLPEEKLLLWKYRYSLVREKKAAARFLRSVDFADLEEARQAVEVLESWEGVQVEEALELLSVSFSFPAVREYALKRLRLADPREIDLYLLQLVQALRYEAKGAGSSLAEFLVEHVVSRGGSPFHFYWFVRVETEDKACGDLFRAVRAKLDRALERKKKADVVREIKQQEALVEFLTAVASEVKAGKARPSEFLAAALGGAPLPAKRDAPPPPTSPFLPAGSRPPFPLPVYPDVLVEGFVPEEASVFSSKQQPLRITFNSSRGPFRIIYKSGDDLRQDQLVVQIIALMDRLLKQESLDLRLTTYRVLATSQSSGMVEFVAASSPLSHVLQENARDIHAFLRRHNPAPPGPSPTPTPSGPSSSSSTPRGTPVPPSLPNYGIRPEVLDNYVRSCAGYCVISYVLGIGDRHFDNLMLTTDGRLFHIDFGYIFGREPKMKVPYLPPMKISSEMVQGLGGRGSLHYSRFQSLCAEAYSILRKSSGLFASLVRLMAHSGIPDVGPDPESAVIKLLERLRPELSEEEAAHFLQDVIVQSESSNWGIVAEAVHRFAQWK